MFEKIQRPITSVESLDFFVAWLRSQNAVHIRRGIKLDETETLTIVMHLMEEAVEFAAEATIGTDEQAAFEEAGDLLCIFLHVLQKKHMPLESVVRVAAKKLGETFTLDVSKVSSALLRQPARTRSSREEV